MDIKNNVPFKLLLENITQYSSNQNSSCVGMLKENEDHIVSFNVIPYFRRNVAEEILKCREMRIKMMYLGLNDFYD